MIKTKIISALTVLGVQIIITNSSYAESPNDDEPVNPVIVTATRTAQTADQSLSSVTVITQEEIERQNATSIQELLRAVAGMSVSNSGGEGKLSSLFIRGTESDHLLVLVDGIKIGSATAGSSAFQLIPVELIERIEIVRGPRSSLYGSEAVGGVVQIFTKKGSGKMRPAVSLSAGSYNTRKAVTSLAGGDDISHFNVSLSSFDTEGFNACNGDPLLGGCYATEPDDDGYRYVSGSLNAGHRLADHTRVDVNWMRSKANIKYDGFYNESDTVQQVAGAKLSHEVNTKVNLSLQIGQSRDESDDFSNGVFQGNVNTIRDTATIQSDIQVDSSGDLSIGLDFLKDKIDATTAYNATSRTNKGLFVQYLKELGSHSLQLSVRRDDNEQFGEHSTGSAAWGYDFEDGLRAIASLGTAFKAPTFNDLYYPGAGNPNLVPEESQSVELGVRRKQAWGTWNANLFRSEIDDLIVYNFVSSMPENIEKASIMGIELIVMTVFDGWNTQFNMTYLDAENRSNNGNKGNELPRRAKKSARLTTGHSFGQYSIGATVIAEGRRFDNATNTVELDSYYTVDLNAGMKVERDWKIDFSVKNLFDEEYETVDYYNTPGRNYLFTLHYQPPGM